MLELRHWDDSTDCCPNTWATKGAARPPSLHERTAQEPCTKYCAAHTPSDDNYEVLHDIMKQNDWIEHRPSIN